MYKYILFDLDGTLTDSREGITKSVQYALRFFDIHEEDLQSLECFIGPPLVDQFMERYSFNRERALEATGKYRERFSVKGWSENKLYPGVEKLLSSLRDKGYILAVASSKPEVYVKRILEHFGILENFDAVVGSELDGTRAYKHEVVEEALKRLGVAPEEKGKAVLVGDKIHDVEGAHKAGIDCIGVTYGFGSLEELKEAEYRVDSAEELLELLIKGKLV